MRSPLPQVSVVVPCSRPHLVEGIARALASQPRAGDCELVVVGAVGGLDPGDWGVACTLVPCSERHPNRRRSVGLMTARGRVFAFLDDDAVPEPGWLDVACGLDPLAMEIWTGPEVPMRAGRVARYLHTVASSPLAEGHRAHIGSEAGEVAWYEAPFCNLVTTAAVVARIGSPPTDLPWDMDDFAWCLAADAAGVAFLNQPSLLVRHDRYPDHVTEWLATKARERARTGEKLVRYPAVYRHLPGLTVALVVPAVALTALVVLAPIRQHLAVAGLIGYIASVAAGAVRVGVPVRSVPLHLVGTAALHVVSVLALYVGLIIGVVSIVFRRPDPFLLGETARPRPPS